MSYMNGLPVGADGVRILCETCADPSQEPVYEEWRRSLAIGVIAIHSILLVTMFTYGIYNVKILSKEGRDPHLLLLMGVGAVAALYTPVRELIGEAQSPCLAHLTMSYAVNAFFIMTFMIRALRLAAINLLQIKAQHLVTERIVTMAQTDDATKVDSRATTSHSSSNNVITVVAHAPNNDTTIIVAANASEQAMEEGGGGDARLSIGVAADVSARPPRDTQQQQHSEQQQLQVNTNTDSQLPHTPVADGLSRDVSPVYEEPPAVSAPFEADKLETRLIQFFHPFLVDICKLHTAKGQVRLWLLCALAMTSPYIYQVAMDGPGNYTGRVVGCSFNTSNRLFTYIFSVIFLCVESIAVLFVRNRHDIFLMRGEIIIVFIVVILSAGISVTLRSTLPAAYHSQISYWLIITSWITAVYGIILPLRRAKQRRASAADTAAVVHTPEPATSPGAWIDVLRVFSSICRRLIIARTRVAPSTPLPSATVRIKSVAAVCSLDPNVLQSLLDGDSAVSVLDLPTGYPAPIAAKFTTDYMLLLHMYTVMFPSASVLQRGELLSQLQHCLQQTMRTPIREYKANDWLMLTIFVCGTHNGRSYLQPLLEREWSMQSLLFLVESAMFAGIAKRCVDEITARLNRERGHTSPSQAPMTGATVALNCAAHIHSIYVCESALFPLSVSSRSKMLQRGAVAAFDAKLAQWTAGAIGLQELQLYAICFSKCFRPLERELLHTFATGVVRNFALLPEFVEWHAEANAMFTAPV